MSENNWGPLREINHHFATALLLSAMLILDFVPVAVLLALMEIMERALHRKDYLFFGVSLETIINHIEVLLVIAFVGVGGFKLFLRLGLSIYETIQKAKEKQ